MLSVVSIIRAEVNCSTSQDFTEASNLNCTEAPECVNEGFSEPEHQEGPELVLNQAEAGMPFLIEEGEETEKDYDSSSIACASSHHDINILETPQVLPISAGSEKDKEPNDPKVEDMKENIEDLDEDREDNAIGLLGAAETASALAQKPFSKLFAKDVSQRNMAMGTNDDFEAA